jgi:chaperonin GroEL
MNSASLTFRPHTRLSFQAGVDQIVAAMIPTYGPNARTIAAGSYSNTIAPEILTDGGTIARRIVGVKDRDEDIGAMYVRQMIWQMHEKTGDGCVTAGILFKAILDEGDKYIAAGGNAARLRYNLERLLPLLVDRIRSRVQTQVSPFALRRLALTLCPDRELARQIADLFLLHGEFGTLDIRSGYRRETHVEFVEGQMWKNTFLVIPVVTERRLEDVSILVTTLDIADTETFMQFLEGCVSRGIRRLLVVARGLSEEIKTLILANDRRGHFDLLAVRLPGLTISEQQATAEDIALLAGAQAVLGETRSALSENSVDCLGTARVALVNRNYFGIRSGGGDPRPIRDHLRDLRERYRRAANDENADGLLHRIGILQGGQAVLWIGGATDAETKMRKAQAERTARIIRRTLASGVVVGGGVAYLDCATELETGQSLSDDEQRVAVRILTRALEAPTATLAANANVVPGVVIHAIRAGGSAAAFNFEAGKLASTPETLIFDPAHVVIAALETAVRSAALALTIDVFVHHRHPEISYKP